MIGDKIQILSSAHGRWSHWQTSRAANAPLVNAQVGERLHGQANAC